MWSRQRLQITVLPLVVAGCAAAPQDDAGPGPLDALPTSGSGPVVSAIPSAPASSAAVGPSPLEIEPTALETWADASESKARRILPENKRCIADVGGCTFQPLELPPCPLDQPFVDMTDDALAALDGKATVLRGTVWDEGWYELVGCSVLPESAKLRCCWPERPAPLLIRAYGVDPRSKNAFPALVLSSREFPDAFACQRDETARCCGLKTETNVLAYGSIRKGILESPRVCKFGP